MRNRKTGTLLALLIALALLLSSCAAPADNEATAAPAATKAAQPTTSPTEIIAAQATKAALATKSAQATKAAKATKAAPDESGSYTTKDDVALYLHLYGHLPDNFITKSEARALGWDGGSVERYAPGKSIGGDRFGNYEGLLPEARGRTYTECDIDTLGASSRGAKRIVFSNDGLVYYTGDHYESFALLYGEASQ